MNNSKIFWLLGCFIFFTINSCNEILENELVLPTAVSDQEAKPWQDVVQNLVFETSIIVSGDASIQDAVNAALPGDVLLLEAGRYQEEVIIDKADLKLIGLDGANGERVILDNQISVNQQGVEIINILQPNVRDQGWESLHRTHQKGHARLVNMTRRQLGGGIAHYQFLVRLGKNEFDVVNIHRLVQEHRPYRPVRCEGAVFMVHGASQDFDDIFLQAGNEQLPTMQTSSPVFLAANHIDVWGIDLGWTRVPAETNDFSFMADWGMERDVDHTLAAMSIARLIRGLSGQGFGRMNLLGFSYGVPVGYAAAGKETQQRPIMRDIKGLITVDGLMKYDAVDEEFRLNACAGSQGLLALINSGVYENNNLGAVFIGTQALVAPDDPSVVIPGLTNYQTGLFIGAVAGAAPQAPFWHFVAGDIQAPTDIPNALLYTDPDRWFRLLTVLAPYQPVRTLYDVFAGWCDEVDVFNDDHLAEISVPILYVGSGGGNGEQGLYTSSLTASNDVTHYIASQQPDELRYIDFGHADLFLANNADKLVWSVLYRWLREHNTPAS